MRFFGVFWTWFMAAILDLAAILNFVITEIVMYEYCIDTMHLHVWFCVDSTYGFYVIQVHTYQENNTLKICQNDQNKPKMFKLANKANFEKNQKFQKRLKITPKFATYENLKDKKHYSKIHQNAHKIPQKCSNWHPKWIFSKKSKVCKSRKNI